MYFLIDIYHESVTKTKDDTARDIVLSYFSFPKTFIFISIRIIDIPPNGTKRNIYLNS